MKKFLIAILTVLMLTSCSGAETVATVGNTKITRGEFEFYLSSIKSQMKGTELQTEDDWETHEIEGTKAIDLAKQRALDIAVKNAEYCEIAKLAKITLTDEDKKLVDSTKKRLISGHGGNSEYREFLKSNNITDKFIDMMCLSTVYYSKISKLTESESPVTDEDIKGYFDTEKQELLGEYKKAKHILILTIDPQTNTPLSEEEQKNAEIRAQDLYKRALSGEDFDVLMQNFSQDPGLSSAPDGYVFTAGEMVSEFEQAVDSVGFGEITMCRSDFGYHIIKRLEPDFEDLSDSIKRKLSDERVNAKIAQWEKDYNFVVNTNEDILKDIK